jgi:HAD superfamily hydrolase (TIGR01549 family)
MPRYKAVLFDKDGVVIDSLDTVFTAFNQTIEHFGLDKIPRQKFISEFWGVLGAEALYVTKMKPGTNPKDVTDYYNRSRDRLEGTTKLFPATVEVLTALKHKVGCKLGIVTSSNKQLATALLSRFAISQFFDVVVGGDEVSSPKPAPDGILQACSALGVQPWEAMFVGDTKVDLMAGKAAKCKTAIVTASMSDDDIKKLEGAILLKDIKDVLRSV